MTIRRVRPEERQALGALTVAADRALLGPDMSAGYAEELAAVESRAALVDVLVEVGEDQVLDGGPCCSPTSWTSATVGS